MPNPILDKITVNDIEYDLVGNGGGHVIEKSDGTDMTQRSNLQFVDAQLTDDSTNDRTKVENVKIIQNESELANLPDGIYMGAQDEAVPFSFEAEDISYDNTTSQLTATNVQAAIDELSQKEGGVQSDWNETDDTKLDYIKNKPINLVQDANYVHTDNNYTSTEKTKLGTIAEGAEVNVQSDWSQTDNTADDYIKNKPTIPDAQIQSDWNQTSGTAKDFIKNKPTLGTASALDVAISGDASSTQVVKGDDSRLSDARTPVAHTHTLSEITDAGTAASKDSTSSVTAGSTDLVESGAVKTAIDNAISGAYKHAGTKTCAELISNLLIPSNNGNVYNITDSGTTTADFIEGAGIPIRAGDNVGIAKISDSIYKFDLLSGFIDTSNFVNKSSTSGLIKNDGSIDTTEYAPVSSVPAAQIQSDWSQSDNTKLDYIKNKPTLGTAAAKNVPSSGDAANSEVVLGNDSRLTDARNAADVYSWAKAENKPSYTKSEVGLGNVDNTSDATKKSNFTGSIASGNTGFVTGGDVYSALGDKVDKVEGKGLSTNDYTTTEKNKLAGIASGAEVNVQSDWNQTTTTADDYIKNKPANLVQDASYVHTDNNYTSDEKTKLSGIAAGAEVNVQSDWDETDDTQDDYIKNKPEAYDAIWQNNNILEGISDKQPYLYRATSKPEGAIEYVQEKLIGTSAAVNQLVQNGNFSSDWNWSATNASLTVTNNIGKFVANAEQGRINSNCRINNNNHKWLAKATIKASSTFVFLQFWTTEKAVSVTNAFEDIYILCVANYDSSTPISYPRICDKRTSGWDEVQVKNVQVIDLTQMFGTAIADLAYSKEQASAGSGIAWLKSYGFFTKDYYSYNTGALQSVKTGSKKVVGKNLAYDITYISATSKYSTVLKASYKLKQGKQYVISFYTPNSGLQIYRHTPSLIGFESLSEYSFTCDGTRKSMYGIATADVEIVNEMILSRLSDTSTTGIGYITDFQIEEVASGVTTPTSYEPYTSTTYPLDSDLELRGLYKLDASNNIICDGDEYTPDGSVKRRYGIVDLGTLSWTYYNETGTWRTTGISSLEKRVANNNTIPNQVSQNYVPVTANAIGTSTPNAITSNTNGVTSVNTNSSTTQPSGYLIYELATPTTDEAASYQNPQIIHENGTEEFIDTRDYPLPVGHDTGYFTTSDEKFFLPPVVDNDGRFLYHDGDGFQFKNFNQVASKVEESDINGNIKIDSVETQVYDDSELQGIVDTDTTTATGNPLNFSTKSAQNAVNTDIVIDPVQDLHGYDKPWVGGVGKNLLNYNSWKNVTTTNGTAVWENNGVTLTATANDCFTSYSSTFPSDARINVSEGDKITLSWKETTNKSGNIMIFPNAGTTGRIEVNNDSAKKITYTVTSGITYVTFRFGVANSGDTISYKDIQIEVGSSATSYEPYTNICPISPKEQITVQGCGKNLFYVTLESGTISAENGSDISSTTRVRSNGYVKVEPNTTYTINCLQASLMKIYYFQYDKNNNYLGRSASSQAFVDIPCSFTTNSQCAYMRFAIKFSDDGSIETSDVTQLQLELGSQETSYEPYTPSNNLQIPLPNDFYGGTLNLESGELRVDRKIAIFNGGSGENWSYQGGSGTTLNRHYISISGSNQPKDTAIILNLFDGVAFNDRSFSTNGIAWLNDDDTTLSIMYNDISSASGFKTWLASNPLQVVYELADSAKYTIHLTPQQLNLLKATNNISTDAKTISVTYRNGELSTYAPATDIADGLLTATDKRAIDRTSDIVEGNPIQFSTESKQIARSTIIDLEPIQDLHGYSKPWVGGAGKNIYEGSPYFDNTWINYTYWSKETEIYNGHDVYSYTERWKGLAKLLTLPVGTYTFSCMVKTSDVTSIGIYLTTASTTSVLSEVQKIFTSTTSWAKYSLTFNVTTAGTIQPRLENSLTNGAKVYVSEYQLEKASAATSYEPYENICPILGYDEVDINGCGENLFGFEKSALDVTSSLRPNDTQRLILSKINDNAIHCAYNNGNYSTGYVEIDGIDGTTDYTIRYSIKNNTTSYSPILTIDTAKSTSSKMVLKLGGGNDSTSVSSSNSFDITDIQVKRGITATDYSPYTESNNISIQLDDTVYGGKLDVENGELVVDREYAEYDGSNDEEWSLTGGTTNYHQFVTPITDAINSVNSICNEFQKITTSERGIKTGLVSYASDNSHRFALADSELLIASVENWKTYLTSNPLQVCYYLATPTTIQLSPHAINLLKGVNTITTNGTSITLNYRNGEMATLEDVQNLTDLLMKLINNLSS